MAELSELDYEGKYNNSSTGLFKNNTTRDITPERVRTLVTDTKDSFLSAVDDVLDEDDMSSNSPDHVPTQQSVKAYVDNAALGFITSWKLPVRVATTANGTLASDFENGDIIDGVVLATGNRILLKDQSTETENGIYVVAASGAPTRATDSDSGAELEGAAVTVQEGTVNANTTWLQTEDAISIGSSDILYQQIGTGSPDASTTTKGLIEIADNTEANAGASAVLAITAASLKNVLDTRLLGTQDLWVGAGSMRPRITTGCDPLAQYELTTSLFNVTGLSFSNTTEQFAQFQISLPPNWNGGSIQIKPYWFAQSSSGGVVWAAKGAAYSNDDALTVAFGTEQTSTHTLTAVNDLQISPFTAAITLAGIPTDGDLLGIQISRKVADGSDTLASGAILLGVILRFTNNANVSS